MAVNRSLFICCNILRNVQTRTVFSHNQVSSRGIHRWVVPTLKELKRRQDKLGPQPVDPRSSYLEWNRNAEVYAFGKRLNEDFHIELLNQAFIHRSYIIQEELKQQELGIENPEIGIEDNGELSILGEEQIKKHVFHYLTVSLPKFPLEGIQGLCNYLTSQQVLSTVSKNLGCTEIILSNEYPPGSETLANTMTAIVGALFKSQGEERTNLFIRDFIITQLEGVDVNEHLQIDDPMSVLTDILKRDGREPPEARLIGRTACNTVLAVYHVGIYSNKQLIGQSGGESIDIAREMAARDALSKLFNTSESCQPISYNLSNITKAAANVSISEWSNRSVHNIVNC